MTTPTPAGPRQGQVNSATGIVGPTGAGKSSLIATAAEYLYDTHRQVLLYYNFSGGGFPTKIQSLVNLGVIRLWRGRTRGEAFETTVRASQGWWPTKINPRTGETAPHVALAPPITQRFTMKCPNGHVVKVVPFPSLLTPMMCATCKTHTTQLNATIEKEMHRTKGFEQVGGVAFDDLTSMLEWQMNDMASRHARQEIKGEETALGGRITSGDLTLGGNNRSHYGFVQTRASEMVHNSLAIPYLSLPPIWTMLLLETTDEGGLPVKGPKLAGKAKTDEAPSWFGNMLEVGVVKDDDGNEVRRLWLAEFIDDAGVRHLVKHRGTPRMPSYLQDAVGEPWGQVHLGVFFDLLAKDVATDQEVQGAKFTDAPGLPEGEVEYGESVRVETPAGAGGGAGAPAPATAAPVAAGGAVPGRKAPAPRATPRPRTMPAAAPVAPPAPVEEPASPAVETATAGDAQPAASTEEAVPAPAPTEVSASAPAAPAPEAPVATAPAAPAPRIAPRMAPPPGPRPPASAPRRPLPRVPPTPVTR